MHSFRLSILLFLVIMMIINFSNSIINDDYCDNGDDEMNTSACSGYRNIIKPTFTCFDKEYYIETVYSSRVNDGICDCCDGSDEITTTTNNGININCINTCKEIGEIKLNEENIRNINRKKGIEKKDKIKSIINSKLNLLKDQYDKAQINLPKYKEILKSLRSEIISKDKKDIKKQEYILEQAKIEIFNNFNNINISTREMINLIGLLALRGGEEAVEIILNNINNDNEDITIDDTEALYIAMTYKKNLSNIMINNDGNIISNINNDSDWLIQLINSLSLNNIKYNTLLNILPEVSIYTLQSGQLIKSFNDLNISIKEFSIKIIEMDKYFSETFDIKKLNQKIKDIEIEINTLSYMIKDYNKMKQKDFGPNKILYEFWNKCYNYNSTEYSYNICPFQDVKQNGNVILGRYAKHIIDKDSNNDERLSLLFTQGDRCMSIPSRRPRVFQLYIECSSLDGHNIIDISEVEKCKYIGTMKSSIGC